MKESDKRAAFLGASLDPHLFTIDLHQAGDLHTALGEFERGFDRALFARVRACRVIYGVGAGILAREILNILKRNKNIVAWHEEESGGSVIILL